MQKTSEETLRELKGTTDSTFSMITEIINISDVRSAGIHQINVNTMGDINQAALVVVKMRDKE